MTRLKKIHPAVATWLITLAIGALTTQAVIAKPKNLCTPQTCGTKTCQYWGKPYQGGDTPVITVNGKPRIFLCDGFTGKLVYMGREAEPSDATTTPAPTTLEP